MLNPMTPLSRPMFTFAEVDADSYEQPSCCSQLEKGRKSAVATQGNSTNSAASIGEFTARIATRITTGSEHASSARRSLDSLQMGGMLRLHPRGVNVTQ